MRVIYYAPERNLSAQIAAAIHLRVLPINRLPTGVELGRIPHSHRFTKWDFGRLQLVGRYGDEEIYLLPLTERNQTMVLKVLNETLRLTQMEAETILCDCGILPPPRLHRGVPEERWLRQYYNLLVRLVLRA